MITRGVALTAPDTPLGQAFSAVLAQAGTIVIPITDDTAPYNRVLSDIDALILLLPTLPAASLLEWSGVTWDTAVNATLTRCIRLIKTVGAGMVARRNGVILIVGGLSGLTGLLNTAADTVLQGALIALTRSLAVEWAQSQVRVLYLACGAVEGEPLLTAAPGAYVMAQNAVERTPLKRAAAPAEIAQIALYLVGPRASFLTGSVIRADGGWTAWGLLK